MKINLVYFEQGLNIKKHCKVALYHPYKQRCKLNGFLVRSVRSMGPSLLTRDTPSKTPITTNPFGSGDNRVIGEKGDGVGYSHRKVWVHPF